MLSPLSPVPQLFYFIKNEQNGGVSREKEKKVLFSAP